MALTGELIPKTETEQEKLVLTFTNGNLEQIRELQEFLKSKGLSMTEDLEEVIRIAIALLLRMKADNSNE